MQLCSKVLADVGRAEQRLQRKGGRASAAAATAEDLGTLLCMALGHK